MKKKEKHELRLSLRQKLKAINVLLDLATDNQLEELQKKLSELLTELSPGSQDS